MTAAAFWRLLKEPLISVVGALIVGGLLMAASGHNPFSAYIAMFQTSLFGSGLEATVGRATPIIGLGLATAIAFRSGFFNLGGEGQFVLGGLAAAVISLYLPLPGILLVIVAFAGAAIVGGCWAWLGADWEVRFGVPLLISTLLLNYPARLLASYVASNPLRDIGSGLPQTHLIPQAGRLPGAVSGRFQLGLVMVLLAAVALSLILRRTVPGYRMRVTGLNPRFARYGGVDIERLGRRVMFASGALAGSIGAIQIMGVHFRFIDGALTKPFYAWTGLMVALLARSRPVGVVVGGFFFAAVQTGGFGMERAVEVPRELAQVIQAFIILFVAVGARRPIRDLEAGEAHG